MIANQPITVAKGPRGPPQPLQRPQRPQRLPWCSLWSLSWNQTKWVNVHSYATNYQRSSNNWWLYLVFPVWRLCIDLFCVQEIQEDFWCEILTQSFGYGFLRPTVVTISNGEINIQLYSYYNWFGTFWNLWNILKPYPSETNPWSWNPSWVGKLSKQVSTSSDPSTNLCYVKFKMVPSGNLT